MSTAKQSQDAAANSQEIRRHGSEHLAQYKFQPGQSGNPAGRPKKLPITDAIRAELEHLGKDGVSNDVAIARVLVQLAKSGNMEAIKEISDRTEGNARQRIEAGGGTGLRLRYRLLLTSERPLPANRAITGFLAE